MKDYIKDKLVDIHKNCSTDKYGQMAKHNLSIASLFGDKKEQVLEYNNKHELFTISTYGASYGTYSAITNIIDPEISQACKEAFDANENRKRNLTGW